MFSELKKSSWPTIVLICVFGCVLGFGVVLLGRILPPILWPGGIGVGEGDSTTTAVETIEKDKQGKTVKKVTTTAHNDGKTLWDWGSLLGVPLVVPLLLAILGYVLQEQQRKIADNETKEEVLQTYFDRLSVLLIDKNLIALSNKLNSNNIETEEKELLESSLDVIRARTLSILRRFENDVERKNNVISFLIETEIVGKSNLNLSGANLQGAKLQGAELSGANLQGAKLQGAELQGAELSGANLQGAKLQGAELSGANLQGAKLQGAELELAILWDAKLQWAKLQGANFWGADLSGANFWGADLSRANLEGADLKDIEWNSETVWPDKSAVVNARNIPEKLKKELGITP
jgi:uncharacterized protein YjbI with pentapeptide repeats